MIPPASYGPGCPCVPRRRRSRPGPGRKPKRVVVQHRCALDQQRHADNLATLRRDFAMALENVVHGDSRVRQQLVRRFLLRALRKDHRKRRSGTLLPVPPHRLDPPPQPAVRMAAPAELPRSPVRFRIKMQPADRSCNRRRLRAQRPAPLGAQRLHPHQAKQQRSQSRLTTKAGLAPRRQHKDDVIRQPGGAPSIQVFALARFRLDTFERCHLVS